ncbi:hypothetical protein BBP40_003937 [Aspergillus hancockii]|nr:hypothetical protein BBP40_003937 [Aspergillus hancockii]
MEIEGPESDGRESLSKRACDQCRARKIRCDKRAPCSNCRSSQIVCHFAGAGQKPPESRRRVLISSQYEKKIDLIEQRLGTIEQVLHDLRSYATFSSTAPPDPCFHTTPISGRMTPSPSGIPSSTTAALEQHESASTFEGNSSLAAHSAYASEFLETVVSQSPLQVSTPHISSALSTLKQIVNMQDRNFRTFSHEGQFPNQRAIPSSGLRGLTMPPIQVVLPLLRKAKEHPNACLQGFCPFISSDRLIEKCQEVYFAVEDYSDATFIVANGGLYYIFSEYSLEAEDEKNRDDYQRYLKLCHTNLKTALANLSLLMPAKSESIEALVLGAYYAIEISKPSFALTLIATASRLCQTLGYHRASSMKHDNQNIKTYKLHLFWSVYCLDKALSLRLGRASTIQDYDVFLPRDLSALQVAEPWKSIYPLWIHLARIQGGVYEKLYSPAALSQSESERVTNARQLASDMQWSVMEPYRQVFANRPKTSPMEAHYIKSDEVCRLSVLTLIYRAIPPPADSPSTFIAECIEVARAALHSHQECMATLKESSDTMISSYLHWTILYSPFVPFIVIFCHTIEVSSQTDLKRLEDFVTSLQPSCCLSEAIAKMHRLCQVLSKIARLYLEVKAQAQEDQALISMGQKFDTYLSALGLASATTDDGEVRWTAVTAVPGSVPGEIRGMDGQDISMSIPQTSLGNWFSGNQHMMGLLEEDLSLFDPSSWPQP